MCLGVILERALLEQVCLADQLVEGAETEQREVLAHFLSDRDKEGDELVGVTIIARAKILALRGDPYRACVRVTLAHVATAERHERCGAKVVLLGAEHRGHDHIASCL